MGWIVHHAIVVTGNATDCAAAHAEAERIFGPAGVTPILTAPVNGLCSFLIGPDGSKENWPDSKKGNTRRARFHKWVRAAVEDFVLIHAVEVAFGETDGIEAGAAVVTVEDGVTRATVGDVR